jgi:hypothetical protein
MLKKEADRTRRRELEGKRSALLLVNSSKGQQLEGTESLQSLILTNVRKSWSR